MADELLGYGGIRDEEKGMALHLSWTDMYHNVAKMKQVCYGRATVLRNTTSAASETTWKPSFGSESWVKTMWNVSPWDVQQRESPVCVAFHPEC